MFHYYQRILAAYLGRGQSQLSFWHENPAVNEAAFLTGSSQFVMTFHDKTRYAGPFDGRGVPMLDYRGRIGRRYNPIAVAQYGLGCFNKWQAEKEKTEGEARREGNGRRPNELEEQWRKKSLSCADWLVENLETNSAGLHVWHHHFDWEYFQTLKAPWYSGLAQGQGIALLARAFVETSDRKYAKAAGKAFEALVTRIADGGTLFVDAQGDGWIEEYITDPPTHILNGFIWALLGVRDYGGLQFDLAEASLAEDSDGGMRVRAIELWETGVATLVGNLARFDCGYWSLYDLAPGRLKNVASPFYHRLHLVQLEIMSRLTGLPIFAETRDRWQRYQANRWRRTRALLTKIIFKLLRF